MLTRTLGTSDLKVSVIGLGTMSWPQCRYGVLPDPNIAPDYDSPREIVKAALESGITLFDTAEGYGRGRAEELLGNALKDLNARDQVVIVSKTGPLFSEEQVNGREQNLSAASIRERCELALKRLKTDRIDLYLAHHPDPLTPIEETATAMAQLKQEGKIRWFGVSNHPNDAIQRALAIGPVVVNQLPYSMIDRHIDAEQTPFLIERKVSVMAYSPLGKGVLTGKYSAEHLPNDYRATRSHFAKENLPAHLAIASRVKNAAQELGVSPTQLVLAWTVAQPGITVTIPGARTLDQVRDNAGAGKLTVPPEVLAKLV